MFGETKQPMKRKATNPAAAEASYFLSEPKRQRKESLLDGMDELFAKTIQEEIYESEVDVHDGSNASRASKDAVVIDNSNFKPAVRTHPANDIVAINEGGELNTVEDDISVTTPLKPSVFGPVKQPTRRVWAACNDGPPETVNRKILNKARQRAHWMKKIRSRATAVSLNNVVLDQCAQISADGRQGLPLKIPAPNADGFTLIEPQLPTTIIKDANGLVIAIIVPHNPGRDDHLHNLSCQAKTLEEHDAGSFSHSLISHESIQHQIHRNRGAQVPMYSSEYQENKQAADDFLNSSPVSFYKGFAAGVLQAHAPNVHEKLCKTNRVLRENHGITPLFGIYPSVSINFDHAVTQRHIDSTNSSSIYSGIIPFGNFDPNSGGHLVLEEVGVTIKLGPGDLILFPSSLITHWNTPIQPEETRSSLAFWVGADLVSWAENGGKPLEASSSPVQSTTKDVLSIFSYDG